MTPTKITNGFIVTGTLLLLLEALSQLLGNIGYPIFGPVVALLVVTFVLLHGAKRYGWGGISVFVIVVAVISWCYEEIGVATGFPFGQYHYAATFPGLWIGSVPALIILSYIGMGYLSWSLASVLLDKKDSSIVGAELLLQPLLASFLMVMWDLSFDPYTSTFGGWWTWETGGAHFGVPLSNYAGWFLCTFTFYVIFAFVLRLWKSRTQTMVTNKAFWLLAALMYLTYMVPVVVHVFTLTTGSVTVAGHVWWASDAHQSMLLVSVFTMVFVVFYATVRIYRTVSDTSVSTVSLPRQVVKSEPLRLVTEKTTAPQPLPSHEPTRHKNWY